MPNLQAATHKVLPVSILCGPFGDRRQVLSFMGRSFDSVALRANLNGCLLTDSEMGKGEHAWGTMTDPFLKRAQHVARHDPADTRGSCQH
jgi:hypothetical protein